MSGTYQYVKAWRTKSKQQLLTMFGNKCAVCSYSACPAALEFHHLDPTQKDFSVSSYDQLNWNKLVSEAKKCILLCCRCHREVHAGLLDISKYQQTYFDVPKLLVSKESPCIKCGELKPLRQRYCSLACARSNRPSKAAWDSIDLEKLLLQGNSFESIGKLLNISGTAVKKRALKHGFIPAKGNPT